MDRNTPSMPENIDPIKLLSCKTKNEDTVTHVAWDKV